jgi:RNA polymerase sigma-70 factor (ECF subfamily)
VNGRFTTTHWSQVIRARDGSDTEARRALASLCETYWYPLYAYVRHKGSDPEEAADLTQAFFTDLLSRDFLGNVDPSKGRFRSFLIGSLNHFLAHEWHRARAEKRGGGAHLLSLDTDTAERRFQREPVESLTPERIYEHRWAVTVMQRAMVRLREDVMDPLQFEKLRPYLTGSEDAVSYGEVAGELDMKEGAVKTAVHRLRQRYGQCLRAEIAETVSDDSQVDDEVRHLLQVARG